jgi:hypothetical protein
MAKRRHKVGGGKRKRSRKVKLLDSIRSYKANAVQLRLKGRVNDAQFWEDHLDRAVSEAEKKGWDESASRAEESGKRIGRRLARKA